MVMTSSPHLAPVWPCCWTAQAGIPEGTVTVSTVSPQAVVARTYALYQKQVTEPAATADLFASTRSQKYLGYQYRDGGKLLSGESEAGRKIAAATRGKVCHFHSQLFCTYYCAVCGGNTVRGSEVFSDAAAPLASVKCDFCREARLYRWTAEISKADLQHELQPWLHEKGRKAGTLKTVSLVRSRSHGEGMPRVSSQRTHFTCSEGSPSSHNSTSSG